MPTLFVTVLAASLLGSLHCAGMCGGFVAFYAGADASSGRTRLLGHLAYHAGRLTTYAILGALAGTLGHAIDLAGSAAGLQQTAAVLAGGAMVVWGALRLAQVLGARMPQLPTGSALQRIFAWAMRQLRNRPPVARAALLGLASTLLPCGWLYAFAITAAGTGHAAWGAAVMAAFWLGTLPVLVGLGVGIQQLAGPLRRHLPAVTAVALMVVGLLAVGGRLQVVSTSRDMPNAAVPVGLDAATARARGLDADAAPCCRGAGHK